MTVHRPLRAVLLAAGFATRLYPLTRDRAKPLLEVGGEPLLTRLVRQLERTQLVADAIVVTNAKFAPDFARWRDSLATELALTLVDDGALDERRNLGAIADLELALQRAPAPPPISGIGTGVGTGLEAGAGGWIVAAGDNLCDFALDGLAKRLAASGRAQLLVRTIPPPIPPRRYNEVELDAAGRVVAFREKPATPTTDRAAICVYGLPANLPQLVDAYLQAGGERDAPGHLIAWLVGRIEFEATPLPGRWFDIGNAEQLAAARRALG